MIRCPVVRRFGLPSLPLFATTLGLCVAAPRLEAQISVEIGAGLTATSEMVSDSIVTPVGIGTDPGFAAAFRLSTPLDSANTLVLSLGLSRNTMNRTTESGTAELTSMNVWFPSVGLRRPVVGALSLRGVVGALIYDAETTGGTPFRDGSPVAAAAGLGLTYVPSFANGLSLDVAWDIHRFNTAALRAEGFGGDKVVHRLTAMIQLGGIGAN